MLQRRGAWSGIVSAGLGLVQALAEDTRFGLPILAHYAGAGALTESPTAGIASPLLLAKLCRLAGADASMFSSIYTSYPLLRDRYLRTAQLQRMPLYQLKPSLPVVGGGIHPATAARIIEDLGADVMLAVGGAIQGHPDGTPAGGRAMRQAIDAMMEKVPLGKKAEAHQELRRALEVWSPASLSSQLRVFAPQPLHQEEMERKISELRAQKEKLK